MKIGKQIISGLVLLMILSFQCQAKADQKIKSLSVPIPLILNNDLSIDKSSIGANLVLVVPETITYKKMVLNKGTTLIGTVKKFKTSKRYRKNGYFEILVNSINYPDTGLVKLKKPIDIKIYNPEIMHRKDKPTWMKTSESILFCSDCAIGGTSLPLYIYEDFWWDESIKDKSKGYKWRDILSKTLIVYYVYDFFKKYPDPNYTQGSEVKIKFNKNVSKKLFVQSSPIT